MKSEIQPDILFHGTTKEIAEVIKAEGLMPMSRQYVHLSTDKAMAIEVAKRKGKNIEILHIDAAAANFNGVKFYFGNEKVWLADCVPSDFIYSNNKHVKIG